MPNRIIKESIHESEDVNKMTDFQFRLWVNLIAYVDDYGRGDARPAVIKGKCFPLRERLTNADIDAALKALAGIGCVGLYEVDGKPYLYFPTWESHQRIRQKVSKYPEPPANCNVPRVAASCGELRPESNPIQNPESESESESKSARKDLFAEFCGEDTVLLKALQEFEKMRKQIKKPMSERAKEMLLHKLSEFPQTDWVEIINQSIFNSWQGIFPLDRRRTQNRPNMYTNNIFLQIAEDEYGTG